MMNEKIKNMALDAGLIFTVPPATAEPLPHQVAAIEKFAALVVAECRKEIQKLWYEENNRHDEMIENGDPRAVAIHVGIKSGLIMAINALE